MSRFVQPQTKKLDLSQGDYLIVKQRLNAGESRRVLSRMVKEMRPGEAILLNPEQVGRSKVLEYLVDWSLTDTAGNIVPIRGKSADEVGTALDSLDQESFGEILEAVEKHATAMDAEREAEKNVPAGESLTSATSPSVG